MKLIKIIGLALTLGFISLAQGKALFVSPSGSDAVSYAANSISSPWATPMKDFQNAKAGDTTYYRAGSYGVNTTIDNRLVGNHGTAASPIVKRPYPGESVTFSINNALGVAFRIERNFHIIEGFHFSGGLTQIEIAYDGTAKNNIVRNCTSNLTVGGDNTGFVRIQGTGANGIIVENCKAVGPGAVHLNSSGIILFRTDTATIRNNTLSNFQVGIYGKHSNAGDAAHTKVEIRNNWIYNCHRFHLASAGAHYLIEGNLIAPMGSGPGIYIAEDGGVTRGDYHRIRHNTLWAANGKGRIVLDDATGDYDTEPGSIGNILQNNVFQIAEIHRYSPIATLTTMDHNLMTDSSTAVWNNFTARNLAAWKTFYGQDASSQAGKPIFIGGASADTITEFRLAAGSPGKAAASDGLDMGAIIDSVGPNPTPIQNLPISGDTCETDTVTIMVHDTTVIHDTVVVFDTVVVQDTSFYVRSFTLGGWGMVYELKIAGIPYLLTAFIFGPVEVRKMDEE